MLGSVATCTIVAIEVGLLSYQAHKAGVFKSWKHKLDVKFKRVAEVVTQPKLKELSWKQHL